MDAERDRPSGRLRHRGGSGNRGVRVPPYPCVIVEGMAWDLQVDTQPVKSGNIEPWCFPGWVEEVSPANRLDPRDW
jgi:hypothetical protein